MQNKVYFSKELNQHFRFTAEGIIFEDKVYYTNAEMKCIKTSDIDITIIHDAKLKFGGEMINEADLQKLTQKYNNEPSNFEKAVDHAVRLIKSGLLGRNAIYKASNDFNVSASAIGQELGKRRKKGND